MTKNQNSPVDFIITIPGPQKDNKKIAHGLKIFFDFAFFFGCSPFRLKLNHDGTRASSYYYTAVSWLPQKLLSIIFIALYIFWKIRDYRLYNLGDPRNPSMYFNIVQNFVGTLANWSVLKLFWFNQKEIVGIANFLIQEENLVIAQPNIRRGFDRHAPIVYCMGILYSIFEMSSFVSGTVHISKWGPSTWWNSIVEHGYFNFFMGRGAWGSPVLNIVIGILAAAGYFRRRIVLIYDDFFLTVIVLALWFSVRAFKLEIEGQPKISKPEALSINRVGIQEPMVVNKNRVLPGNWRVIKERYLALATLSDMINELVGTALGFYLFQFIVYYSVQFNGEFVKKKPDGMKIFLVMFHFGAAIALLLLAADIPHKMGTFKNWLLADANREIIPADELYRAVEGLKDNAVAVKGGNIFAITYNLLADMIGVIVVYFVICLQYLG